MTEEQILARMQNQTMRTSAVASLSYHHEGILRHFSSREDSGRIPDMTGLICEAIAYLNWVKRIWHYYQNVTTAEPSLCCPAFKDRLEPLVKWFANKWASHRAVDYPRTSDTSQLKLLSTQLDTCLMFDQTDGPFFPLVDDQGNSLAWCPLREHAEVSVLVKDFIDSVVASQGA